MKSLTFFSYKGGAGRTSALMNLTPVLGDENHLNATPDTPIILVDMDIDSAGLTYLLNKEDEAYNSNIYVQYCLGQGIPGSNNTSLPISRHPFFSKLCKVGDHFGLDPASVLFLPAKDGAMIEDTKHSNYDARISPYLTDMLQLCEDYDCAAVIFDSASGDQMTARWSTNSTQIMVCCMRPTKQFREGSIRYLQRFERENNMKDIVIVPNVVPPMRMTIDGDAYPVTAKLNLKNALQKSLDETKNTLHLDMLTGDEFGIPMVPRFMWLEGVLATIADRNDDEESAYQKYVLLADIICNDTDDSFNS